MKLRLLPLLILLLSFGLAEFAPYPADESDRDAISQGVSRRHLLGTDNLGRDRFSRLLVALRTSLMSAALAAACSVALGVALALAVQGSRPLQSAVVYTADVFTAVPGFLLVLLLRGSLPLSLGPMASLVATFLLLAALAWPATARLSLAKLAARESRRQSEYASALGLAPWQIEWHVTLPALASVAATQCAILLPAFVLAEADLGLLGLGAIEPMASIGSMLRELVIAQENRNWLVWTPVLLTAAVITSFHRFGRRQLHVLR